MCNTLFVILILLTALLEWNFAVERIPVPGSAVEILISFPP